MSEVLYVKLLYSILQQENNLHAAIIVKKKK
jgi:hypothetical protein